MRPSETDLNFAVERFNELFHAEQLSLVIPTANGLEATTDKLNNCIRYAVEEAFRLASLRQPVEVETPVFVVRGLDTFEYVQDPPGTKEFMEELHFLAGLHRRKAQAYSGVRPIFSNFRDATLFGVNPFRGVMLRIHEKWQRVNNLVFDFSADYGETLIDTLRDIASYCIIAIIMYREDKARGQHAGKD